MTLHFNLHEDIKWYALSVKVNCEKKVQRQLLIMGIDCFVPLVSTIREWSDRKKKVQIPLIPAIVFVKCTLPELQLAYNIRNVFGPIKYLGKPAPIVERDINTLKKISDQGHLIERVEMRSFPMGSQVIVLDGPFNGIKGVVVGGNHPHRIAISVESLGQSFILELPSGYVIPNAR
jgi:transcription antitermination factor NusG